MTAKMIHKCPFCKKPAAGLLGQGLPAGRACFTCHEKTMKRYAHVDRREQARLWYAALENMPYMAKQPVRLDPACAPYKEARRGAATALRLCLGYHVYTARGISNAQMATYNAIQRGAVPRGQGRQALLGALAGPHGATLARARLIQLGQADRFKYWPETRGPK